MNVDPAAILALISTLTAQNAQLLQENTALKAQIEGATKGQ
jgi:cell division protein FtsB